MGIITARPLGSHEDATEDARAELGKELARSLPQLPRLPGGPSGHRGGSSAGACPQGGRGRG